MRTYTVDDKHDSVPGVHARANFCMTGALIQAIVLYFGHGIIFDLIELDYFFSPVIIKLHFYSYQYHLMNESKNDFLNIKILALLTSNILLPKNPNVFQI